MKKKKAKKKVNKETKTYKLAELAKLVKKCKDLWSQVVKKRAGYKCELQGYSITECSPGFLNAHHIEAYRMNKALAFDPRNGVCSCPGHHSFAIDSCHNSFVTLYSYMVAERPEDICYLLEHYKDKVEITKEFCEKKIKEFQEELNEKDQIQPRLEQQGNGEPAGVHNNS
jgi:hypothetical protein